MTDLETSIRQKEELLDTKLTEFETVKQNIEKLVVNRNNVHAQLKASLSDPTVDKEIIKDLKKTISNANKQIKEGETTLNKILFERGQIYEELRQLKRTLNHSDYDEDEITIGGFKIQGIEEFCNNPATIEKLLQIVDPAVLERILRQ